MSLSKMAKSGGGGAKVIDHGAVLDELVENTNMWANCFGQMRDLPPTQLNAIRNELLQKINSLVSKVLAPIGKKIYESFEGDTFDRKVMIQLKNERRSIEKKVQPLINTITSLVSTKGTSNKKQSLKREMRSEKSKANVAKATSMSMSDKFKLMDKYCKELGCLMVVINTDRLKDAFNNFTITDYIKINDLVAIDDRAQTLPVDTVESLMEVCSGMPHYLANTGSIALPKRHSKNSIVPLMLCDKHINCKDPNINWKDEANEECVALFRILFRSTIANCSDARFDAKDNELGYFLIHCFLLAMESLVATIKHYPDPETDFDETVPQIMRGAMGQLLALQGSTLNILCFAHEYVYKDYPIKILNKDQHWTFMHRMALLWPYTCWSPVYFHGNIRRCLVKIANRYVADAVRQIHDSVKQQSKVQIVKDFRTNPIYDSNRAEILEILTTTKITDEDSYQKYRRALWSFLKYFRINFKDTETAGTPISNFWKYHHPQKNNSINNSNKIQIHRMRFKHNIIRIFRNCMRVVHNKHLETNNPHGDKSANLNFDPPMFLHQGSTFATTIDGVTYGTEREAFAHLDSFPKIFDYFLPIFNKNLIAAPEPAPAGGEKAVVVKQENPLLEMLSKVPNSTKAVAIVKNLPTLTVESLGEFTDEYVALCAHVTEKNPDKLLREMTEFLLYGYKNLEKATNDAATKCFE